MNDCSGGNKNSVKAEMGGGAQEVQTSNYNINKS